jgi:hypothetical protein
MSKASSRKLRVAALVVASVAVVATLGFRAAPHPEPQTTLQVTTSGEPELTSRLARYPGYIKKADLGKLKGEVITTKHPAKVTTPDLKLSVS